MRRDHASYLGLTLLTLVSALSQPAQSQELADAVALGSMYAKAWCAECHLIEPETFGVFVADFVDVANLPSTTALSLKVFLQTSHKDMPNVMLTPDQADAIVAYILSLKHQ